MITRLRLLLVLLLLSTAAAADEYQSQEDFLLEAFDGTTPKPGVVWLKGDIKKATSDILGHAYPGLRIRYWGEGTRTAWILEEIGKVKPITVGLVVNDDGLEKIRVLAFRDGQFEQALSYWREVLAIEPLAVDAHGQVATLLADTGGRDAAMRDRLVARGWRCDSYHAGLTAERREAVHAAVAAGLGVAVVARSEVAHDPRLRSITIAGARLIMRESDRIDELIQRFGRPGFNFRPSALARPAAGRAGPTGPSAHL